jgi:hypothetical protein
MTSDSKVEGKEFIDDILKLSVLKDDAKSELADIFESLRGRKCLLVDTMLFNLLNQIVSESSQFWTEHGINLVRELSLDTNTLIGECCKESADNYIYLVRPHLPTMKAVAHQIKTMADFGMCNF